MKRYVERFYFAYGSNLYLEQMKQRCPDSVPIAKAKLMDHELTFRGNKKGAGVADAEASAGKWVDGALYKLTPENLEALDRCEGVPDVYDRFEVVVKTGAGDVEAFTYKMLDEFRYHQPTDEYFERVLMGYRNWAMPEDGLIQAKESVKTKRTYY